MKWLSLLIAMYAVGAVSCTSQPESQSGNPSPEKPVSQAPVIMVSPGPVEPAQEDIQEVTVFDYANITEEVRTHTRAEIQHLIGELDGIIEDENYYAWVQSLDKSYLEKISSRDFLAAQSQSPRLKSQEGLKNAEEYFKKVVVPSRVNTDYRIDDIDIQFVPEEEKVLAFLTTQAGRRLRLYELKNVDGIWKIAN
jgi:hypothetical protein